MGGWVATQPLSQGVSQPPSHAAVETASHLATRPPFRLKPHSKFQALSVLAWVHCYSDSDDNASPRTECNACGLQLLGCIRSSGPCYHRPLCYGTLGSHGVLHLKLPRGLQNSLELDLQRRQLLAE